MNNLKTFSSFVNEQLDDFFEDFANSKKNIRLFSTFSTFSYNYERTEIKVNEFKKKFQPKLKIMNTNKNKGIF
jgi:flavodoxin